MKLEMNAGWPLPGDEQITIATNEERLIAALLWFDLLQKTRVALNAEIVKGRQEVLFYQSLSEKNKLCQK